MGNDVREFHFSQDDFNQVRNVLYKVAGIKLADSKDSMVYSRLARRLRALKMNRFSDYLRFLSSNDEEIEHFINGLTTNLTSFFRENHHFEILHNHFVQTKGKLRIWCAASSTGEEPYSIAICAAEAYGTMNPPVEIIATDIDSNVLATASAGVYPLPRVQGIGATRLKQFFHRGVGSNAGKARVVPELRKLITFDKLNLTDAAWPNLPNDFDVIFCRNVMIYFDRPTQMAVLGKLISHLSNNGLYFAGHSESFLNASTLVKPIGKTVYRKVEA